MIGIDTNALLRLFTTDSPEQTAATNKLIGNRGPSAIRLTNLLVAELHKRSGQAEACPQSSQLYQEKVTGTISTTCCRLHDNRDQFQRPLRLPKQRHELM
jgi:hypothetical protein